MSPVALGLGLALLAAAPAQKARDGGAPDGGAPAPASAVDAGTPPAKATLTPGWSASPHRGPVLAVAFSRDGAKIATGAGDRVARIFDAATGKLLHELPGASTQVSAVAFSPDGKRLATGESALVVRLYAVDTGKLEREIPHPDKVSAVAFSPDGALLAVGGSTGTGQVYAVADGKKAWDFSGRAVAFSVDGKAMVSAVPAGALRLWDPAGKRLGEVSTAPHQPWLAAGGDLSVTATWNPGEKVLRLWDVRGAKAAGKLEGHEKGISSVAVTADGARAASASEDHTLRLWDLRAQRFAGHAVIDQLAFLAFAPDGKRLAVAQGARLTLYQVAW